MPYLNENMSELACRERVEHLKSHEQIVEALAFVQKQLDSQNKALKLLHEMCNILKKEIQCLKQDS